MAPLLTVFNDIHIGTVRTAGTTPMSAFNLRRYLLSEFEALMAKTTGDVLINGDLLDKEIIPLSDLSELIGILASWLSRADTGRLILPGGNHDLPKSSSNHSSFQFLADLLCRMAPGSVVVVNKLTEVLPGHWVLPHMPNQDLLDAELAKVPECKVLYVHTNFDNNFAAQSDQSLNITRQQVQACKADYIVFGHEHQTKVAMGGRVIIPGNQIASSIADCLNCRDDAKFYTEVGTDGVPVLKEVGKLSYAEMPWNALKSTDAKFVRVTGEALPDQGAAVAQAISRYRSQSQAFVVANAVTMLSSEDGLQEFASSLEQVLKFDVMGALLEYLTPAEGKVVKEVMNVAQAD